MHAKFKCRLDDWGRKNQHTLKIFKKQEDSWVVTWPELYLNSGVCRTYGA